jgi:hypothetical protein
VNDYRKGGDVFATHEVNGKHGPTASRVLAWYPNG